MLDCRLLKSSIENQLFKKKKKFVEDKLPLSSQPEIPVLAGKVPG